MSLVRLAGRHGRAVMAVTVFVAIAGAFALTRLPRDIYPPLNFRRIVVIAHSGSLPPRSMMLSVTRPLEQALMEVPSVRRVRSRTFRGTTEISALFAADADIASAFQLAQGRIAEARSDIREPLDLTVERMTTSSFPMFALTLTGGLTPADLRDVAFYVIRPALARVPGAGPVEVLASDSREIEVAADPRKLLAAHLTVPDLAEALRETNVLAPTGRMVEAGRQNLVLASGPLDSLGRIRETPIVVRKGTPVRVGDVAEVFPGTADRSLLVTGNGRDCASISVSLQPGANIQDVRAGIEATLRDLTADLPSRLTLSTVYDLAGFVATAIANVRDAILVGGALAVFVLLAFLRNLRLTAVAALTLPLTVLATFLLLGWFGESINLMSMGGLAVAIGLVIDDAVVVVENIHRRAALAARPGREIVEQATEELVAPVLGSTLTTVVVLAPLGLLSGVAGQFFRALSITLSIAVLVSLVLAFTLIPLLSRPSGRTRHGASPGGSDSLSALYARSLSGLLSRPFLATAVAAGLVVLVGLSAWGIPTGFLPHMDEGGFIVDYLTPPGSSLEESNQILKKGEAVLSSVPEIAAFARRTGSELGLFATEQNKGDIIVRLKPRSERSRSADAIIVDLRRRLADAMPGVEVEFIELLQDMLGDLEGNPAPIEVKVFGDDPDRLNAIAGEVEAALGSVRGVVDRVGPAPGSPEVTWEVDPLAAGRIGLTVQQVADQMAAAWLGESATELRLPDRTVPVRVRFPDADRLNPLRAGLLTIRGSDGEELPVTSLAHATRRAGQSVLMRENLRPMALVTARLEDRDLGSAVREIRNRLGRMRLPVGYTLEVGGQYESQRQAFLEMLSVLALAVCLVFLILLVQFRALVPALLLILAAPLSFGGAFLLLRATGTELNVSSAMGLILLVGLVVKNGIVFLDYAHRVHRGTEGAAAAGGGIDGGDAAAGGGSAAARPPLAEAILAAARVRLRPILMTTLCTLFGLTPLALGLGAGAELQRPLALAVIGGLGLSTLITLYLIPSVYVALSGSRRGAAGRAGP